MNPQRKNRAPERTCIGCMEKKDKSQLVRIAMYDGELKIDITGKANGRGVYLCPKAFCITNGRKRKAIQRRLGIEVKESEVERVLSELEEQISDGINEV